MYATRFCTNRGYDMWTSSSCTRSGVCSRTTGLTSAEGAARYGCQLGANRIWLKTRQEGGVNVTRGSSNLPVCPISQVSAVLCMAQARPTDPFTESICSRYSHIVYFQAGISLARPSYVGVPTIYKPCTNSLLLLVTAESSMDSPCGPSSAIRDLQPSIRRSRVVEGSCWTCRKRRVKCDIRKPSCTRCLDAEQPCSYSATPPIKWVGGISSRRRLASVGNPSAFRGLSLPGSVSPSTQPLDRSELRLYFSDVVLPRFVVNESIEWDLDDVLQNESLLEAVTAVSQAHYARYSKVDVYDVTAVRKNARYTAIEAFRRCLQQGLQSDGSVQMLFAVNILFCMLDGMIEPSDEHNASTCHLRGGWAILHNWPNTPTRMLLQDGLQAHLLSIYGTMDLVHALLSGDKPFFQSTIWVMFSGLQTWFGRLPAGDRFLEILTAFADMASLGHLVHANLPLDSVSLVSKCLTRIEAIFDSRGMQNNSEYFGRTNTSSPSPWATFCSIYEICGVIYLQRALRLRPADDEVVQAAARRGVEKVIDPNLPGIMRHCVIFPMLVIGSHCTLAQDRQAILQALSPSSSYLSFGNMQLMADFLRETWAREATNKNWWDFFSSLSEKAFLF